MKQVEIPLTSIQLDESNPRVAWIAGESHTPEDLYRQYWAMEDVFDLVKSIDASGLYQHIQILVEEVKAGNKYIVLEGNRRIVAMRSIMNPSLAPQNRRDYLETVRARRGHELEKLLAWSCTRDEAYPIIVERHASADHASWESLMKARLYWDYFRTHSPKLTMDQMAAQLLVPKGDFQMNYRTYVLYTHARRVVGLTEAQAELLHNERRFPITTLVRIAKVADVRIELGLSDTWEIEAGKSHRVLSHLKYIVVDLLDGQLSDDDDGEKADSRSLGTAEKIRAYWKKIKVRALADGYTENPDQNEENQGSHSGGSSGSAGSDRGPGVNDNREDHTKTAGGGSGKPRTSPRRHSFFRSKVSYAINGHDAFRRLFETLHDNKKVSPEDDPIACGILVRSFLDKGTRVLFERKQIPKVPIQKWDKATKQPATVQTDVSDSEVKFSELLQLARTTYAVQLGIDKGIADNLNIFINGSGTALSDLSRLNSLVHKPAGDISANELHDLWPRLEKYIRLLVEVV